MCLWGGGRGRQLQGVRFAVVIICILSAEQNKLLSSPDKFFLSLDKNCCTPAGLSGMIYAKNQRATLGSHRTACSDLYLILLRAVPSSLVKSGVLENSTALSYMKHSNSRIVMNEELESIECASGCMLM